MSSLAVERMQVEVEGSGDPVIMLHGLGGTSNTFCPQVLGLGGRYRTIRPDLPGSGRSPLSGSLTIQSMVDAVVRAAKAVGAERAHFVGHSMGTIVCQHIAEQHPELVRSLALFGPIHQPPEPARKGLGDRAAKARNEGMTGIADQIVQATLSGDTKSNAPVAVALVREFIMRQDAEGYARNCEALAAAQPANLDRIKCPVRLVTGDEDPVAPASNARTMAERLSDARVTILTRCGHWSTIERPQDCNQVLKELLGGRA
ncbi:alpha/beta fold hydrolase [Dongia sedimenti]|uniref:Alpha/beta hydrolase n=1 Tax=Dongia sedimenti TaxID=3064282 RepID=A0ABU0YKI9_9PROT|nr:alpha/beta hydrolase [Rhodospirillaceae bacterium R-7]